MLLLLDANFIWSLLAMFYLDYRGLSGFEESVLEYLALATS